MNDIKNFIEKLGFTCNLFTYSKEYKLHNYTIRIDLQKDKIYYRKDEKTTVERLEDGYIQLGDHTTSNFSAPESLIVLECVNRLLEKGYSPHDIHIERRWKVGHGASGGKADINVYGKDGKTLLIIECKTWGFEFEKEKSKMEEHGGQLFTYLNQDKNVQFLVLYASKLENDEFIYDNLIVQVKDRKEDLEKSLKQIEEENIKLYRDANNKSELFDVWKESFNKYFHFNGIFDADANAYSLELKALKKKNLVKLDDAKGLFNKFAEILRHNNISDNANAFNRVLSLFLCKIVDEEITLDDDVNNDPLIDENEKKKIGNEKKETIKKSTILRFQVKEDEKYEHIIDRLQELYQIGMRKLNEEVVYFSEDELNKIIQLYPKQTPLERVVDIFYQLKYYTNNEFAFKEVHNKKLFVQNARVLVEIIKLIQNYQFRFTSKQQILGDFFELMLNHGVKQSEGQFFTPIPIVRYIILSLGFENIINEKLEKEDAEFLPKILDYACGAGHFLTESIEELQQIVKKIDSSKYPLELSDKIENYKTGTHWASKYIFGIEKDYRLARTSQIACYINGDGDANIIFGDGLEGHDSLKLDKKKFDVVIANPPYSVEAFKNYLNVGRTHFELLAPGILSERSSQIEALFIERTKQVLADNGLAGIVLPSTILSNTGIYTKVREILLKHFEIKAITELGSKTFIATGTTTVILFLKRRNDDFLKDREYIASDLFNHTQYAINIRYIDAEIFLKMFTVYMDFDLEDYKRFLSIEINNSLSKTDMFIDYRNTFDNSTEKKQLLTKTYFKNYTKEEKEKEITKSFYEYCKEKEKEKFLYFMLCLADGHKNPKTISDYYKHQQTVIVKTGKEIDEQKEYLGYEFIGRKGQEGIKMDSYGGKMFDETNYENPEKANFYMRNAFAANAVTKIHESQQKNINIYRLVDLIDFNRVEFEKIIKLNSDKKYEIQSKWEIKTIGNIFETSSGGTPLSNVDDYYKNGSIPWINSGEVKNGEIKSANNFITELGLKNSSAKLFPPKTVLVAMYGATAGQVGYLSIKACTNQAICAILPNDSVNHIFLYQFFKTQLEMMLELRTGVARPNLSQDKIKSIQIPVPPIDIQQKIVSEIEKIEKREKESNAKAKKLNSEIFEELQSSIHGKNKVKLDSICTIQSGGTPKRKVAEYWNGNINWLRSEVCQNCYVYEGDGNEKITELGLSKSSAKLLKPDTILMALVGMSGVAYLTFEAATNQNVAGLSPKDINQLLPKYLFYVLQNEWDKFFGSIKGTFKMVNLTTVRNLEIPLPTIEEQKKLVAIIDLKEKEIEKLKLALSTVETEKEEVLKKYL